MAKVLFLIACLFFVSVGSPALAMEVKPPTFDTATLPGGSVTRVFLVRNTEDVFQTYTFSIQGFRPVGEEGRQAFLHPTDTAGLPSWIYLNRSTVTLAPGESTPVTFQFRPPKQALPGAYQGVIFVNHASGRRLDGVTLGSRVGVLVFATVEGNLTHAVRTVSFTTVGPHVVSHPPIAFVATLRNEGTAHETPVGRVDVVNVFGHLVAVLSLQPALGASRVVPGSIRRFEMHWGQQSGHRDFFDGVRAEWSPFLLGFYQARLVLDQRIEADPPRTIQVFVIPWRTTGLFAFVTSCFVGVMWAGKRRRRVS